MPVMDINADDLEQTKVVWARLKVLAYMNWPSDEAARLAFLKGALERSARAVAASSGTGLYLGAEMLVGNAPDPLEALRSANPVVVQPAKGKAEHLRGPAQDAGQIAGSILLRALELQAAGRDVSTIALDELLEHEQERLKGSKNAKKDNLRGYWTAFRPVAHLWAAQPQRAMTYFEFIGCLLSADDLGRKGEGIRHRNAPRPLLDADERWRLPDPMLMQLRKVVAITGALARISTT